MKTVKKLLTINEASEFASAYTKRKITPSNISYLIQYARVHKFQRNGSTHVSQQELQAYYDEQNGSREKSWKQELGQDLNWNLSFEKVRESERTKHVHRLHPYKGKFIPQLVAYFLDQNTDDFKQTVYFQPNDIVLDPFCGSGTTLVQANELGLHAIGFDISQFNAQISNVKVKRHRLLLIEQVVNRLTIALKQRIALSPVPHFEEMLNVELSQFNQNHFPSPEFKHRVRRGEVDAKQYGKERSAEFQQIYNQLVREFNIQVTQAEFANPTFLDKWYLRPVRDEIDFMLAQIGQIEDEDVRQVVEVIFSRTVRSCRATTHSDLATLVSPVTQPYYCRKHNKICKPLFSLLSWWERYSKDTLSRFYQFDRLRTETYQHCLVGDSRSIVLVNRLKDKNERFGTLVEQQKIKGIFSSPPYVGLINYHEQHAYSYDLYNLSREDDKEIGPMFQGKGKAAREAYVAGIAAVLNNARPYLAKDFDIFLVANDRFGLYERIAELANLRIVQRFRRPVLHRTEKDKSAYAETIFHMKGDNAVREQARADSTPSYSNVEWSF